MQESIKGKKRWLILLVLSVGAGLIFQMPYLRLIYYIPLQKALGLDHTHFGTLLSTFGMAATFCHFPGGWLADRISARKLLSLSLIGAGMGGFYFATFPSYEICLGIFVFWAITTILTFWSVLIKTVSILGSAEEQGKLMGLLEGGRGLSATVMAFATMALFSHLGQKTSDLSLVIQIYSAIICAMGLLIWGLLDDRKDTIKHGELLKDIMQVIRMPLAWMVAGIVFTAYTSFIALSYTTPYLTEVYGLSVVAAGTLSIVRTEVLRITMGPLAGLAAQKAGSTARVLRYGYILTGVCLVVFLLLPATAALCIPMIVNMLLMACAVFAMRGIYWATISEIRTPANIVGTMVGFVSMIGFLPDAFMYTLVGRFLDTYPGVYGYRLMFGYVLAATLLGLFIVSRLLKRLEEQASGKTLAADAPIRATELQ